MVQQVAHTSWLMYEYTSLERLYEAGAAVPKPISSAENALLMGYCGDENTGGAGAQRESRSTQMKPSRCSTRVLRNIELMLQNGMIHGDLSAYNILYWEGEITLIDFPQVTDSAQQFAGVPDLAARHHARVRILRRSGRRQRS